MICFKVTTKGKIELDVTETDFDELKELLLEPRRKKKYFFGESS